MELSIWFSPKSMLLSIRFSPILKYLVIYTLHNIHSDACLHSLLPQLNNIDPENIRIRRTVSRKIACIVVRKIACILATLTVNFILSSMNLQRIWDVGRMGGAGVIISDRMSYRNHYMCSGEATSILYSSSYFLCIQKCHIREMPASRVCCVN